MVSSLEEKTLLSDLGVPDSKVSILPIGVDTGIFKPCSKEKTENLLLFVGRIYPIKGLHILLSALLHIKIPVHLIVIGSSWDSDYMKKIEGMANEINSTCFHKVTFLGEMTQTELALWYQKASLVVCPYIYETYSNVIRESLACGTPVVSTGTHLLENCSDGISLAKCTSEDLAVVINELLSKPDLREKIGQEGRELVEKHFSWKSVVQDLIKIYRDVANPHSSQ